MDLNELKRVRATTANAPAAEGTTPSPLAAKIAAQPDVQPLLVMSDEDATKVVTAMRIAGHTQREIALELGATEHQIRRLIRLGKDSRKIFGDIIDGRAVPTAIDNLIAGLEAGDKDYTLKTLEGRGLLVKHSHQDGQAPKSAFQFNIVVESPTDGHREPVIGSVVGEPRQLESHNE